MVPPGVPPRVGFVDFEPLHQSQDWLTVPFWNRLSVDHMTDAFWINRIQFSSQTGGGTLTLRGGTPDSGYVNQDTEISVSRHRFWMWLMTIRSRQKRPFETALRNRYRAAPGIKMGGIKMGEAAKK